jgi:hypothetical protein
MIQRARRAGVSSPGAMCAFDGWRGAKTDTAQRRPAALMAGRSGQLACGRGSGLVSIIRLLETKIGRPGRDLAPRSSASCHGQPGHARPWQSATGESTESALGITQQNGGCSHSRRRGPRIQHTVCRSASDVVIGAVNAYGSGDRWLLIDGAVSTGTESSCRFFIGRWASGRGLQGCPSVRCSCRTSSTALPSSGYIN